MMIEKVDGKECVRVLTVCGRRNTENSDKIYQKYNFKKGFTIFVKEKMEKKTNWPHGLLYSSHVPMASLA